MISTLLLWVWARREIMHATVACLPFSLWLWAWQMEMKEVRRLPSAFEVCGLLPKFSYMTHFNLQTFVGLNCWILFFCFQFSNIPFCFPVADIEEKARRRQLSGFLGNIDAGRMQSNGSEVGLSENGIDRTGWTVKIFFYWKFRKIFFYSLKIPQVI